jgi:hypothetical protein
MVAWYHRFAGTCIFMIENPYYTMKEEAAYFSEKLECINQAAPQKTAI